MNHYEDIKNALINNILQEQNLIDDIKTFWIKNDSIIETLIYCKNINKPYNILYDITAIDERERENNKDQPNADFTIVYFLFSIERNNYIRFKVPLIQPKLNILSACSVFKNANWYEREIFDMFGIIFDEHPFLQRILMPPFWQGYPLRKEHYARATETQILLPKKENQDQWQLNLNDLGFINKNEDDEFIYLNLGPQHPGTHGILRVILKLRGEEIEDLALDIGYHHRGAEKMAERQTWHGYIPYTDRIDYLGGVMNNLAYLLTVEQLAQIIVPPRAQIIRVMLCELFRIASHLVWYGTFAQDIGSLSVVFYLFNDREEIFNIIENITGGRMHPSWFRIGGVAKDLPDGWQQPILQFIKKFLKNLKEYDKLVINNSIFKSRTIGIGSYSKEEALSFGVTGAGLRACGLDYDFRKKRPYSSYEEFDFDIPTAKNGDCYDRSLVRIEEMRQSARIIEQCINKMPPGPIKSDHPLTTPPKKEKSLVNIETLINHFLNVSYGPVMPSGESFFAIEASKGCNSYYIVSDNGMRSYRTRIRTPSFAHLQMLPYIAKGSTISDLLAILGSIDFVLADLDR